MVVTHLRQDFTSDHTRGRYPAHHNISETMARFHASIPQLKNGHGPGLIKVDTSSTIEDQCNLLSSHRLADCRGKGFLTARESMVGEE
jgi:hypothetical protein